MKSLKAFARNIVLLIALGMVLYFLFPDMMRRVFELYGALFGPIMILVIVMAALPRKRS